MSDLTEFIKEIINELFTIVLAAVLVGTGSIAYALLVAPK